MTHSTRLDMLTAMYARITGDSQRDARSVILKTDAGRAINRGSEVLLYNQPTNNLQEIAAELPEDLRTKFTFDAIFHAWEDVERTLNGEERNRTARADWAELAPKAVETSDEGGAAC